MTPIHIIGQPGSGKTTLIVDLIKELVKQNIKVGSIKHSSHIHELDKPGKDSFQHRKAGASPVTMVTKKMAAIYLPVTEKTTPQALLEKYYSYIDIVLIEGWISGPYKKIEIWRKAVHKPPLFSDINQVKLLISDDILEPEIIKQIDTMGIALIKRNDIVRIVDYILNMN